MWTKVMREWGFGAGAFVLAAAAYAMHFSDQGEKQEKKTIWADQIIVGEDPKNRVTIVPGSITVSGQSRGVGNGTAVAGTTEIRGFSFCQDYHGSRQTRTEDPSIVDIKSLAGQLEIGVNGILLISMSGDVKLEGDGLKFGRIGDPSSFVSISVTEKAIRLLDADGKVIWESAK